MTFILLSHSLIDKWVLSSHFKDILLLLIYCRKKHEVQRENLGFFYFLITNTTANTTNLARIKVYK